MSYYWTDEPDPGRYDEPPHNAECHDCGVAYARGEHDRTVFCDECSDRRDAWATAQELKAMAKAVLRTDLMKVRDIA